MTAPWAREASPSVTLPPPPAPTRQGPPLPPPVGTPVPVGFSPPRRPRRWPWAVLALLVTVVVSAAVGSTVTYLATHGDNPAPAPTQPSAAAPSAPAVPQVSPGDAAAAKQNLCQVFDVSVRGQQGQGGVPSRGEGERAHCYYARSIAPRQCRMRSFRQYHPMSRRRLGSTSAQRSTRRRRRWATRRRLKLTGSLMFAMTRLTRWLMRAGCHGSH